MKALIFTEDGLAMAAPAPATPKGNPFLTGLDYTLGHFAQCVVFERVECFVIASRLRQLGCERVIACVALAASRPPLGAASEGA